MNMPSSPSLLLAASSSLMLLVHASGVGAEPRDGSPIRPLAWVQGAALHPGEDSVLLACLTNSSRHGGRDLPTGTTFEFAFPAGGVGAAVVADVSDPTNTFLASDWSVATGPDSVHLTFVGSPRPWPRETPVCARIAYTPPPSSTVVMTDVVTHPPGAIMQPEPGSLALAIDADVGNVGPTGPVGPIGATGPEGQVGATGPRGATGVVQALSVASTGTVVTNPCGIETAIPGLEATVAVVANSRLNVTLDIQGAANADPTDSYHAGIWDNTAVLIVLELDGMIVESIRAGEFAVIIAERHGALSWSRTWLSPRLPAGTHYLRVLVQDAELDPLQCIYHSLYFGGDTDTFRSRMTVIELSD